MNLKQQAAARAVSLIKDNDIVGLGAGSTMAYVAEFLKEKIQGGLSLKLVTSSFTTKQLLAAANMFVLDVQSCREIDIYFDGCDQLDHGLSALKSGGGIHTQEKLLASMSRQFVLVGDGSKLVKTFDIKYPLVIEMLPQARSFVSFSVEQLFPDVITYLRSSEKKDGPIITENGNYLLDLYFGSWPVLSRINPSLKNIPGIVETSLFYKMAHKAIIASENGVTILDKNEKSRLL
jgi:ribose 5-phosphate isomerase A